MYNKLKKESFSFKSFICLNSINEIDFVILGKQLKLAKKWIRFAILLILLSISISSILRRFRSIFFDVWKLGNSNSNPQFHVPQFPYSKLQKL